MARELFIYWKLPRADAALATAAVAAMQTALRARHIGLLARLLQRADATGDAMTLMETYALPPAGISTELQRDIEAAAALHLDAWRASARHVEVFQALSG